MKIFQPEVLRSLKRESGREDSPVLSVYLNVDPSLSLNSRGGYRTVMDQMLRRIAADIGGNTVIGRHFEEDSQWVRRHVETLIPGGKTFIAFCDVSEGFFYEEEVPLRFANAVFYHETPYIRPLIEAVDECERYAICLLDSEKARLFILSLGQIEEMHDTINIAPVKHRKGVGSDQMRSQTVFQRRAETWTNWFLKDASTRLYELMEEKKAQYIILMGPSEVTSELFRFLPKVLQEKVVARLRMSVKAKPEEVLEVAMPVVEERERSAEMRVVTDLATTAQKVSLATERAVLGINPVLDMVNQGRAYLLVYPSGIIMRGYFCPKCEVLLDHVSAEERCPYCESALEGVDDILSLASEKVLASGGKLEEVKSDDARRQLLAQGMVGAFLR